MSAHTGSGEGKRGRPRNERVHKVCPFCGASLNETSARVSGKFCNRRCWENYRLQQRKGEGNHVTG
jgi:hypothetical protein